MASRICYNLALFAATAAALSPLQISQTSRPLQQPQSSRRNLLAGAGGLAAFAVVETASAAETTAAQKEEIAKALEKAVSETAAAAAAGAEVTSKFLEDPATRKALKEAGETAAKVTADAGAAAGEAAWALAKGIKDGSVQQSAANTADVLSLPARIAAVAATDGGDLGKAIDECASGKVAKAVGDATVDVLASVVDGDAKRLDSAGATVAGAFELATREAPVVSGFVAGVALSWLLGLGKDAQIEAQSREIARLKKSIDDVTGLKKLVGLEKA
ncbi:asparagine-tRNA ligase [Aureococcus anophagefferens]|nr:asparagine-tRNA ligase [Aureococcus anophagefferens]